MSDNHVVHWIGPVIFIKGIRRQRCMWCGALVDETDLNNCAVAITPEVQADLDAGRPVGPVAWEVGAMVAKSADGGA